MPASVSLSGYRGNSCYSGWGVKYPVRSRRLPAGAPATGFRSPQAHLPPGPTRPGSHAVWPPPARAVSRKGFRISCVGTEAALSRWGPEAAVGPRGHVARRPRCQRPPAPRPTWGRFKGGRRISQPRAQRPAGCLGASQGGTVSAQSRNGAAGASAPTPPTRRQPLKPTPQAGSPALPRKGRGPGLLPVSPRHLEDDHRFPQKKPWNLGNLSGPDELN